MSVINERAVRYADVLLLLSESYLRSSGRQDLAKAVGYLNQIRERANLNPYSGAQTSEAIFSDLEHQRAIEFFVEGERFYLVAGEDLLQLCAGAAVHLHHDLVDAARTIESSQNVCRLVMRLATTS